MQRGARGRRYVPQRLPRGPRGDGIGELARVSPKAAGSRSGGDPDPDQVLEDGAERGDAGGDSHLAKRAVDARRHAAVLRAYDADGGRGQGGIDQAHPDPRDDEARQQRRPARVRLDAGVQQQRDTDQREPHAHQHPHGNPGRQAPADRREHEGQQRAGQETYPRLQRREFEDALDPQRHVQEQSEQRAQQCEGHDRCPGERRLAKQRQVEHRVPARPFREEEGDQQHDRADQEPQDGGAGPAFVVAAHEREDEHEQRGREGDEARPVDPPLLTPDVGEPGHGGVHAQQADWDVEVEDGFPPEPLGQHSADQRSDGDGRAQRSPPDPECRPSIGAVELLRDQGQRGGEHHRPARALGPTSQVQEQRAPGQAAQRGGRGEDDQPEQEHALAPQAIGQRSRAEQEGGQGQRVGVDHPLQVREARLQRTLDRGQRDVDDRHVEQQHERAYADDAQRPPLARAVGRVRGPAAARATGGVHRQPP